MKLFSCNHCGQRLYFENVSCTTCNAKLGFLPESLQLVALESGTRENLWRPIGATTEYRFCANATQHAACNWMLPAEDDHTLCEACRLNKTIPDLSIEKNLNLWRALEKEKRRLVYSLLRFNLPITKNSNNSTPLSFDFLADCEGSGNGDGKVLTGHSRGLITINLKEADPAEREWTRGQMEEPYRTLLGHFRHESGHFYWDCLIRDSVWLQEFRNLFGDESADYGIALQNHYQNGARPDWAETFISSYAAMHPWEDWAETWAHYLHMVDTMETAWHFNISMRPSTGNDIQERLQQDFDPYHADSLATLIEHWLPLTFALNSLNRSMGHPHAYPFVISAPVMDKLKFIHRVIHSWNRGNLKSEPIP